MFGEVTRKCCLPVVRKDKEFHCKTTFEKQKKKGVDEANGRSTRAVLNKELKMNTRLMTRTSLRGLMGRSGRLSGFGSGKSLS